MYIEYKGSLIADITLCIIIHIKKYYILPMIAKSGLFKWPKTICILTRVSFRKMDKGGGQNNTSRKFRGAKGLCVTARPLGWSGGMSSENF